ncbi:MAG TPA: FAD-dependent monooxygenase, partial [Bacteroidales bacterium]|nr:FAD-dependent monooxygenase [Bacteroidales bacterium]
MPEIKTTEIAILGAGAAGLTAAIRLGQLGIPCLLIDKGEFPRSKICGDGLSGKTLSALKM